jgi:hypothetical protein
VWSPLVCLRPARPLAVLLIAASIAAAGACVSSTPAPSLGGVDASFEESDAAPEVEAGPDATADTGSDAIATVAADADADAAAGADADADADAIDSGGDATVDAGIDAAADAGPPTVILTAVNGSNVPVGATYAAGAWSALSTIGADIFAPGGGGVTVLPDGGGVVVLRGNGNTSFETTTWTGTWPALVTKTSGLSYIGAPIATATGAAVPHQNGTGNEDEFFDELNAATSTWTMAETTTSVGGNLAPPAAAITLAGDPLLLAPASTSYTWSVRTGGTWSAVATIAGVTPPSGAISFQPLAMAVNRAGADQVVAVFVTSTALESATFSAGTWSAPISVATDLPTNTAFASAAVAALADGTVAMAYVATGNVVKVAFWSGSAWSAFAAVPSVAASVNTESPAVSLARGGAGALLELAYIDSSGHLEHVRLTSKSPVTWTAPVVIDSSATYGLVAIAVGP